MILRYYSIIKVILNFGSEEVILLLFVVTLFIILFQNMNIKLSVKNSSVIFIGFLSLYELMEFSCLEKCVYCSEKPIKIDPYKNMQEIMETRDRVMGNYYRRVLPSPTIPQPVSSDAIIIPTPRPRIRLTPEQQTELRIGTIYLGAGILSGISTSAARSLWNRVPLREAIGNAAQESVLGGGGAVVAMTARQFISELYENERRS